MREILFKAKTEMIVGTYNCGKEDGEWVQGYLRCDCGKWLIYQFETDRADQVAYEVNPDTICQYTGLTDKNGNKIWENDIIGHYSEFNEKWYMGIVSYGEFNCSCCNGVYGWTFGDEDIRDYSSYEVIGNTFDNPDLLKGE